MMRKLSLSYIGVALTGVAAVGFSAMVHPMPRLVWNASASVPMGFYRVVSGEPQRGDFVFVRTPESAAKLADQRGYLPVGVPLVKRLSADAGDYVCALNSTLQINGVAVARQLEADNAGRPLPLWKGCRELGRDEYFLLAAAPDSFDSRYFGPVKSDRLMGRLVPLWTE
jgi:conjugative transfer signal peptidase TraF